MRQLVTAVLLLGLVPAQAAVVCATPQEMKVLQSAALQQQLAAAAMSCRMTADYGTFVAAYRDRLMLADQSLRAFFAARKRGETYDSYKARIARQAALQSERDPRFCDSAAKVFNLALGRRAERNGLAPEPPRLIETGYEGCRPVDARLLEAAVIPRPRPQIRLAAAPPKPPAARPPVARVANTVVKPETIAANTPFAAAKPVQVASNARPPVAPMANTIVKPVTIVTKPPPATAKPVQVASTAPARTVPSITPAVKPASKPIAATLPPPSDVQREAPDDRFDDPPPEEPSWSAPAKRFAAVERPRWRAVQPAADDDPYANDPRPFAYRPGAEWVWRETSPRQGPPRATRVLGPDGHWMIIVRH